MSLNLFDLGGRTALVTGSSSGIGLAIAKGLAAAGARVAIHGRDAERVKTALAEVPGAVAVRFDVADEAGVATGIAEAEAALGRIDILVNNAGVQQRGPLTEFALADWNRMLATHLTGAFLVARSVVPGMAANGGGKIMLGRRPARSLALHRARHRREGRPEAFPHPCPTSSAPRIPCPLTGCRFTPAQDYPLCSWPAHAGHPGGTSRMS